MSSNPRITIDTNIFLRMFNREVNINCHIEHLLTILQKLGFGLCIDDSDKIMSEYRQQLEAALKKEDEHSIERYLIKYWILYAPKYETAIDLQSEIIAKLRNIIRKRDEETDRIFIAVACLNKCYLVTDDHEHILSNAQEIKRKVIKKLKLKGAKILSSLEAREEFLNDNSS